MTGSRVHITGPSGAGRTLVTGGAGFIARHLIPHLMQTGRTVQILDLFPPPPELGGALYLRGDIRDPRAVRKALTGCDEVFHLAAAHHDHGLSKNTFFSVNVQGTQVLVEAMIALGVTRICFTSTVAVYGNTQGLHSEHSEPIPISPYGESKLAAEGLLRNWAMAEPGREALVLRPAVVFGPHSFANMYTLIRQISRGLFVQVGPGTNVKSVVYVDNLVDAMLALWSRAGAEPFDLYNVVDKPDLTSREIADAIHDALGRRRLSVRIPLSVALSVAWPFDMLGGLAQRSFPISTQRVRKFAEAVTSFPSDKLHGPGICGTVPVREGIRRTVEWFLEEGSRAAPRIHLPPEAVSTAR